MMHISSKNLIHHNNSLISNILSNYRLNNNNKKNNSNSVIITDDNKEQYYYVKPIIKTTTLTSSKKCRRRERRIRQQQQEQQQKRDNDIEKKKKVRFSEKVNEIKYDNTFIMIEEDYKNLWYSTDEIITFRNFRRALRNRYVAFDEEDFCIRGLEDYMSRNVIEIKIIQISSVIQKVLHKQEKIMKKRKRRKERIRRKKKKSSSSNNNYNNNEDNYNYNYKYLYEEQLGNYYRNILYRKESEKKAFLIGKKDEEDAIRIHLETKKMKEEGRLASSRWISSDLQ